MVLKKKKRDFFIVLGFIGLTAFLIIKRQLLITSPVVEQYASYVTYPLMVMQQKCIEPLKQKIHNRKTNQELQLLVAQLQAEKEALQNHNIELQSTLDYFQDIKELTAFKQRYQANTMVLAQILSRQLSEVGHYCWIDAGSTKGISPNMIAVYKGCLLGRVTEVYPWYSKLELITDKSCKIAAHGVNSKASGIYQGINSESIAQLNHVSHLATLQEHDVLISSGEGLVFPRGFGIGKMKRFEVDGLFYQIDVQPLLDVRAVSHCYILQRETDKDFKLIESPTDHNEFLR